MNIAEALRPKRKELVIAAEGVMEGAFSEGRRKVNKAQLSHLIGVCNEAACAEEIELYIRYQASRKQGDGAVWDRELALQVIEAANRALSGLESDTLKVAAWRLYAVYLTRAFTFRDASQQQHQRGAHHAGRGGRR
ncbi:hypothetical protein [Sorangium sp. So ce1099]|uniref:hypothetical protein n=1 Tax=Sorangium sp. So ce1099 TaxID=3133331 RepID=UPI003F62AE9B